MPEVEKEMAAVKAGKRPPIVADKQSVDYDWRGKSSDQWSKKDCLKVLSTFSTSGGLKCDPDGCVEAQWFSTPYYQAYVKISEMVRTGKIKTSDIQYFGHFLSERG